MENSLLELKKFGVDCPSYFLLKTGLKPVIRLMIRADLINDFESYFQKLGFFILVGQFNEFYGNKLEQPIYAAYLSKSKELCEKAYGAEKNQDRKTFGKLLGYPNCCIDEFTKSFGYDDLTINSIKKTKTKPSFYCNSLFNFDSKLNSEVLKTYQENFNVFGKYQDLFLIRHIPCSFDCKESIKIGKKTLQLLKKEIPQLAKEIVNALKRPILYFDYFNWIVFDGKVKGNELRYKQALPYESLFPKEKVEVIKKGNKIKIFDNNIQVLKDENILLEIQKEDKYKGILIDFN